ncbi:PREDICTED: RILP-like protein 1 [Nipponia nippon]|uniref:RILP-like protein 1 n=3 Tax=Neoaves TaxID=3078114 RepID=UPI00051105A9|nr:PREDICTED: RILP-like protein 1 [Nipponia nippon]
MAEPSGRGHRAAGRQQKGRGTSGSGHAPSGARGRRSLADTAPLPQRGPKTPADARAAARRTLAVLQDDSVTPLPSPVAVCSPSSSSGPLLSRYRTGRLCRQARRWLLGTVVAQTPWWVPAARGPEASPRERKHQRELELVEDVWRGEAQDLLTQIAQLQEENKQLMTNLSHKDINFTEEEFQKHEGMSERERQVMKKLKEVVDKQRDEIRAKDRELGLKNEDVEALQQQQNRLMKINHDLRHRITVVEAQGKALIEQKVELEAYLQTKEQEMGNLRAELGKLREKLQGEDSQNGEEVKAEPNNDDCLSESEKMAMDLKDPNRPRFTLQELRDVLHERNELKSKVFLLQEELLYYKSEETEEETRSPQPTPIIQSKPSTQPESGIKRLFSFFSRDKKRMQASQKNVHFQDTFGEWSNSNKDDSYTEQGQEALQHL